MPKTGLKSAKVKNEQLIIMEDLKTFTDDLFLLLADESPEGLQRVVVLIQESKELYEGKDAAMYSKWITYFTRIRGPDIEQALRGMAAFPKVYTRLQEFQILISKGEWTTTSFNYLFFISLIESLNKYAPPKPKDIGSIVDHLQTLLTGKIEQFKREYETALLLARQKNAEVKATAENLREAKNYISLFNDLKLAIDAKNDAQKPIEQEILKFLVNKTNDLLEFTWIDRAGNSHDLKPTAELLAFIESIQDITHTSPVQANKVKDECLKARAILLDEVKVLVDPAVEIIASGQGLDAVAKDLSSTFLLRQIEGIWTLHWVNIMSQLKNISLNDYSGLQAWLSERTIPFNLTDLPQLKAFLLKVIVPTSSTTTNAPLNEAAQAREQFKLELMRCLGKKLPPQTESTSKTETTLQPPKKLDMKKFQQVSDFFAVKTSIRSTALLPPEPQAPTPLPFNSAKTEIMAANVNAAVDLPVNPSVGKVDLDQFDAVAKLFGAKRNQLANHDTNEKPILEENATTPSR